MPDYEHESSKYQTGADRQSAVSSWLQDCAYERGTPLERAMCYSDHLFGCTAAGVTKRLRTRATNAQNQLELLEQSLTAIAIGVTVRAWRTTPWPIAGTLAVAALSFLAEKVDPTSQNNAHRNEAIGSVAQSIISHRKISDRQWSVLGDRLGADAADLLVVGSGFCFGVVPRLSLRTCGTVAVYTSETVRSLVEPEFCGLTDDAESVVTLTRSTDHVRHWMADLNHRGLRASLTFNDEGEPLLETPSFASGRKESLQAEKEGAWWRNPTDPFWTK